MKYPLFLSFLVCAFMQAAFAQENRNPLFADLAIAANGDQQLLALSGIKYYGVGKSAKFKVGVGVRLGAQRGSDLAFVTAPAILTSGAKGPQVIFTDVITANYDTLTLARSQATALNLSLNFTYDITGKFAVGFNIDAVGVSFGATQKGVFSPGDNAYLQGKRTVPNAESKPSTLNLLLISDNDRGTLNSELFARYALSDKLLLRGGASFGFTEYTATTAIGVDGNDRFRNKSLMGMVGLSYRIK